MALQTMFQKLRREQAKDGFGNMISVANESAIIRDAVLEEMDVCDDVNLTDPDAEEKIKNEAIDDEEMEKLIEDIPESEIDDAAIATAHLTNQNVPVDEDEYVGAPLKEMLYRIDLTIPDSEEI